MYWSAETLLKELPDLITPFDPDSIDCASYVLKLGEQVFITEDNSKKPSKDRYQVQMLNDGPPGNTVFIEPGQFAFLLTHEIVKVPNDAIAFISMKATFKFKGLINVSGFHVDPGFSGKLTFSVYNAGPSVIALDKRQNLFQIFYAGLDMYTAKIYKGKSYMKNNLDSALIAGMTGQVFSPMYLQRKIEALEKSQRTLENRLTGIVVGATVIGSAITIFFKYFFNQ